MPADLLANDSPNPLPGRLKKGHDDRWRVPVMPITRDLFDPFCFFGFNASIWLKPGLDEFIRTMKGLAERAKAGDAEFFQQAPRLAPRRRLDEADHVQASGKPADAERVLCFDAQGRSIES